METLGQRIRRLRENLSLTQEQLAKRIGIAREAVSKWESGKSENIKLDNLINTQYAASTATGAAAGAATGAIIGAILGLDIGTMAAAGAAGGGLGGLGNESMAVRQMVVNCMRGRGYSVLR